MDEQIARNRRRSALLIAAFIILIVLVAEAINALTGNGAAFLIGGLVFAVIMSFGSYYWSDKIALRMSRARQVSAEEQPRLHNIVEGLCIAAGLPMPRVYIVDDPAPNAFATGRNPRHAAIAVTTGLLDKMSRIELEGVLAHELSHIKNYDILVSTIAVTLVGVIVLMSDWALRFMWWGGIGRRDDDNDNNGGGAGALVAVLGFALLLLAPIAAQLMQFAVSRRREQLADVSGVRLTRYPPGLISALEKLKQDETVVHTNSRATAHLWIESPLDRRQGRMGWLNRMFDTHPPLDERIRALQEL
jgi:heat shock protein HtpX